MLGPLLAVWKRLMGESNLKDASLDEVDPAASPLATFVTLQRISALRLVHLVHSQLKDVRAICVCGV